MSLDPAVLFAELGRILCICPNPDCLEMFYLSEARPYLVGKQPKSIVDKLRAEKRRIEQYEEELAAAEDGLREKAAKAGLKTTKKLLRAIDPTFSGAGYDPQDVKVIFDPVTYIVFHGMSAKSLEKVVLLGRRAEDKATERINKSIEQTVQKGNFGFSTLRVGSEGQVNWE